eukprot:CCRYP_001507-RA/>CCRYP_001507-RA protein AED:0.26 eAED:0.26 QI:0/0/0/1/0/0/2/0/218
MNLSNLYLMTPLPQPEYLCLKLSDIPTKIITEYCLNLLAEPDGTIYVLMRLGMYGLPQAGLLANELLENRLNAHGYHQSNLLPGLWSHIWCTIQFTLVVDDFSIKYVGQEHPQHLLSVLQEHCKVNWDYAKRGVHLSMPGYVEKALRQFQHSKPKTPQKMRPFPLHPSNMAPERNTPKHPLWRRYSTKMARNSSNKSAVNSCFSVALSTQHFSATSAP